RPEQDEIRRERIHIKEHPLLAILPRDRHFGIKRCPCIPDDFRIQVRVAKRALGVVKGDNHPGTQSITLDDRCHRDRDFFGHNLAQATKRRLVHDTGSSGSTKTSILPPQASPTSHAARSEMPYLNSFGVPDLSTCCASRTTALSTHPPLTDPAISPSAVTARREPTGRGAVVPTFTTVAIATFRPSVTHSSISGNQSLMTMLLSRYSMHRPRNDLPVLTECIRALLPTQRRV